MYFCPHFPKSNVQCFQRFRILGEKQWKEVVSDLKKIMNEGCKVAAQKMLYNKDQEVIQQGSGGYTTRVRRLFFLTQLQSLSKKLLIKKDVKSPNKKVSFFSADFALLAEFVWYLCYCPHRSRDVLSPICNIFLVLLVHKPFSIPPQGWGSWSEDLGSRKGSLGSLGRGEVTGEPQRKHRQASLYIQAQ